MTSTRGERGWMSHGAALVLTGIAIFTTMVLRVSGLRDELLDVEVPNPVFLPGAVNITIRTGDVAVLTCSVRNLGTKQVAWRHVEEDRFLTIGTMTWSEDENISLDHKRKPGHVTTWNLMIRRATPKDSGKYECQVTSRAGLARVITLSVVGPPIKKPDPPIEKSVISITGLKYVDLGHRILLTCNASAGYPIPDEIDWFKGGDKIDGNKYRHIMITKNKDQRTRSFVSELIIDHSRLTDTGDYICRSSRNDIANLKVTVLHAGTDNSRREAGPDPVADNSRGGRGRGSYRTEDQRSNSWQPQASPLAIVTCTLLTLLKMPSSLDLIISL